MILVLYLLNVKPLFLGVWVFVTMLPTLMLNSSERDRPLGNLDIIGWALWALGMGFEVIADFQKSAFRRNPSNKVKSICYRKRTDSTLIIFI